MTTTTVPAPAKPRPAVGWTELAVAAVSYVLVLPALVVAPLMMSGVADPGTGVLLAVGVFAALGAVALALAPRVRSLAPLRLTYPGRRWLLAGLAGGIGVFLLNRLVVLGWYAVTGDTGNPQQYLVDATTAGGWSLVGVIVLGGLLTPFAEELLFRGIGFSALRRYGPTVAILGSAAIFGLAHGFSVVLAGAFVLGLVNAWMVERSGSIWPSVVVHATNNLVIFVLVATVT